MTKQRAFANQEREYQARRFGKFGRAAVMTLATLLSFFAISLLVADQMYRPESFKIGQLKIKGEFRYIKPSVVEAAIIDEASGNFFSIDLDVIKAKAENLAWVESVDVRREWPETLVLHINEHRPAMRWGTDRWVTTGGAVIELPSSVNGRNIITLNGRESQAKRILLQATRWNAQLAKQGLEVLEVSLSDSDAWSLKILEQGHQNEFELLLGHQDVSERLARFELLFGQKFQFSENKLKRVDARYPDGLAVAHRKPTASVSELAPSTFNNSVISERLVVAVNQ